MCKTHAHFALSPSFLIVTFCVIVLIHLLSVFFFSLIWRNQWFFPVLLQILFTSRLNTVNLTEYQKLKYIPYKMYFSPAFCMYYNFLIRKFMVHCFGICAMQKKYELTGVGVNLKIIVILVYLFTSIYGHIEL